MNVIPYHAKYCAGLLLYAVHNCATSNPRLARVQDPFGNLLAKAEGSVLVNHAQVAEAEAGT